MTKTLYIIIGAIVTLLPASQSLGQQGQQEQQGTVLRIPYQAEHRGLRQPSAALRASLRFSATLLVFRQCPRGNVWWPSGSWPARLLHPVLWSSRGLTSIMYWFRSPLSLP
jgi:hypothetical protein